MGLALPVREEVSMEFCGHCRAPRRTRRSTRKRSVRNADGTVKIVRIDSYHCAQCGHFIRSDEYEPAPPPSAPAVEEEASTP
jgi:hypothetical protein